MISLELLSPARNYDVGVAAIDCGADAVYIAGPQFGARKDAPNRVEDIEALCSYAHRYGVRIFVTFNIELREGELEEAHTQMLACQKAGADAFIIRDVRLTGFDDITVPLHASTQCAIRDVQRAKYYESLGCSRIILERELSLERVREICSAVDCEVEFFVHGALCVCYSGECRLSESIDGRSADRGECIQACRSLYDLEDDRGHVLIRNKALLSLKDLKLKNRLEELALAGVTSFKIEGRLKNESYVKNVVREYSLELDALVSRHPDLYRRASFGRVTGGFSPDSNKTFNRGYTQLFLDGKRDSWSSKDAPKSMGEAVGSVERIRRDASNHSMNFRIKPFKPGLTLSNGDGFSYSTGDGVTGFRGDVCSGLEVTAKDSPDLRVGSTLYRNINSSFEKILETHACIREIGVELSVRITGNYCLEIKAVSEDGRLVMSSFNADVEKAINAGRAEAMLREQLSKRSAHYSFHVSELLVETKDGSLPLLSSSTINSMRRLTAGDLDAFPCKMVPMPKGNKSVSAPMATPVRQPGPLMHSKYCVRYELGLCPVHQGAKDSGKLFLVNNGRRFALQFDCRLCEMTVVGANGMAAEAPTSVQK